MGGQLKFNMIQVGNKITPLVIGPITTRMMFAWSAATSDFSEIHYDQALAVREGLPDVIIQGGHKLSFLIQMLVNWIGLNGRLRQISVKQRGIDIPGTIFTCQGTVVRKYVKDDSNWVECEIWLQNQNGECNVRGTALITLPS